DGKYVAFVSDSSGEDEIYIQVPDGRSKPVRITTNGDVYKFELTWSPDSKKIVWGDKKLRLQYVDIDSKKITEVDRSEVWEFRDYSWAPDSKWLTYTKAEKESKNKIYLYHTTDSKKIAVTDGWYDANQPVISPDGKY